MHERIRDIMLSHKGKRNAISSSEIARIIGIIEDDTHSKTRALLLECAEKFGLPLAASNKGYYLITSRKEFEDYMDNLDSRSAGIEARKKIITNNFREDE